MSNMYDNVYKIIKHHESKDDFAHAEVTEEMLVSSEKRLNVRIPAEYRRFLKTFGHGGIGGMEVLGIGKNGAMVFEETTLRFRGYGMPNNLLVIENCDEWVFCINADDGKVVMWSVGRAEYSEAYHCFDEFLSDRVNDILENM